MYSHILYGKRVKLLVYCSFILLKILFEHSKKCLRSDFLRGKEPFIMKKTVCVIFGGASSEYEVSLMSSASIIRNLDTEKFDILTLGITKDGRCLGLTRREQIGFSEAAKLLIRFLNRSIRCGIVNLYDFFSGECIANVLYGCGNGNVLTG